MTRGNTSTYGWKNETYYFSNGFRPALEVLDPDTLGSDGLKEVTLNLNGGSLNGSTDNIKIICAGDSFTAPSSDGLTAPTGKAFDGWKDTSSETIYAEGADVPHTVDGLTAQWGNDFVQNVETGETYGTLQGAVDAVADGQTIKLLKDVKEKDITINKSHPLTLELNGKILNSGKDKAITKNGNGTLKITDNSGGSGKITSANTSSTGGTIFLMNGTAANTVLEIKGGTIENTAAGGNAIYNDADGKIVISNGSPVVVKGDGMAINKVPDLSGYTDVKISASSNVTGNNADILEKDALTNSNISNYKYLKFETNNDVARIGSQAYLTLQAAVDAVADEQTITLLKDIDFTEDEIITTGISNRDFTLDLNGFTLNGGSGSSSLIQHNNAGTLTITDSQTGGKITSNRASSTAQGTIAVTANGSLIIDGGTVENTLDYIELGTDAGIAVNNRGTGYVRINNGTVSAISVTGTGSAITIEEDNGALQMLAAVTPQNASNKAVTWSVTNEDGSATDKAIISSSGLLTAVKNGTVKVTATSVGTPAVSGTLEITISNQVDPIATATAIADLDVAVGTELTAAGLPTTAEVTLTGGSKINVDVTWDAGTPAYDKDTAGTYTFSGTLDNLPAGVTNPSDVKAAVNVVVSDTIATATAIADLDVAVGTELTAAGLPTTAEVTLTGGSKINVDVTWDAGTPAYDKDTAGTYTFSGTLDNLPAGVTNPSDVKAAVNVVVE
ncbi:MAG: beta strand repeat-containing protein [Lutisporaceae bacterium]